MQLLAEDLAASGEAVELWSAQAPGLPRSDRSGGLSVRRLAPPGLLAPAVWAGLLLGRGRGFDVVVEEVMGGERVPFLARLWAPGRTVGMWYQDFRPLFRAQLHGRIELALAFALQSALLVLYRRGRAITCSVASERWLVRQGLHASHVGLAYPRLEAARATPPRPFDRRRNLFVAIGNFRATKRFEEAIEVLSRLRRVVPDAALCLLGRPNDEPYLDRLRQHVRSRRLEAAVTFRLDASEQEKFEVLQGAKALTVHSPIEGFGWTVPEAGLCGVPAVVNPGVPADVFQAGCTGELVPFQDVEAYVRVLSHWCSSREVWEPLSRGAYEHASRFLRPTLTPELADFLRGGPARGRGTRGPLDGGGAGSSRTPEASSAGPRPGGGDGQRP